MRGHQKFFKCASFLLPKVMFMQRNTEESHAFMKHYERNDIPISTTNVYA